MRKTSLLRRLFALLPLVVGVGVSVYCYFFTTPDEIVAFIGVQNAYLLMYTFAALGGLTTFNTVPYYSLILVLVSAGVNPLLLGIFSAFGVMTGDAFSFWIGHEGAGVIPARLHAVFMRINHLAQKYPREFPLVCFVWGCFSPFSNNFITIPAALAGIPFKRVMVPLALGNVVFNIGLAFLSLYAYNFVRLIFVG